MGKREHELTTPSPSAVDAPSDAEMAEYVREHRCYNARRDVTIADWDRGVKAIEAEAATSVEALREALSWALDVLDMAMRRLATVSPSDALNVHPAFHAGSVKARAALLASAGEAPRATETPTQQTVVPASEPIE